MHKITLIKKLLNILLLIVAVGILGLLSKEKTSSLVAPSVHADEPAPPAPAGDPGCGGGDGCGGCASGDGCGSGGCP